MSEWQFSAQIDEDGDLLLEWYKAKGNIVTVCFDSVAHVVNWAALVEGVSHHGCIKGYPGIAALGEVKDMAAKAETGLPLSDGAEP